MLILLLLWINGALCGAMGMALYLWRTAVNGR